MSEVVIINMNGWEVVSYGNGLSYSVTGPNGIDIFFQGDDAIQFRDDLERWETNYPDMYYSDILLHIIGGI